MKKKRILVIGSSNIDLVLRIRRVPDPGESAFCPGTYDYIPGGKGSNAANMAARLGADVQFCSRIGNDMHGTKIKSGCASNGIDTRFIVTDKTAQTGLAVIMVEPGGENRILVYSGANARLNEDDLENAFMCYPDAIYLQFELEPHIIINAVRHGANNGIPVFIDAGPGRPEFPLDKLAKVEIFSPNEHETAEITGVVPTSMDNCLRACVLIMQRINARYVVLKLGERGSYVFDGKYCDFFPAYEVEALDTTAAGDAFTAALTCEYMRTGDIARACRLANAVGALTVTKHGAFTSLPSLAELERFIELRKVFN